MKKIEVHTIPKTDLKVGINFLVKNSIIVFLSPEGAIQACRNRCQHQGGQFIKVNSGCIIRCPMHNWLLDVSKMAYVNPSGGIKQSQLKVAEFDDRIELFEEDHVKKAWDIETAPGEARPVLSTGEFKLKFYTHACAEIFAGNKRIFTDPWLIGPAFTRGWWLQHEPPSDWLTKLATADAIYISHNHSDHMHLHTLKELLRQNPEVPLFVPNFESKSCIKPLKKLGFKNVRAVDFGSWQQIGPDCKLMILHDATGRDDSGLLIDYKGYRLLNTVDCANLENGHLPDADVLLSFFAGGASGYPICWGDLYSESHIVDALDRDRKLSLKHALDTISSVRPKIFIPFAGYFSEAHPADYKIQQLNRKNSAEQTAQQVRAKFKDVQVWAPIAGATIDLANGTVSGPTSSPLPQHNFKKYCDEIDASLSFEPLKDIQGVQKYMEWASFEGNVLLHIIETDESFEVALREYYMNFQTGQVGYEHNGSDDMEYIRMRVRAGVFRYVMKEGLPWEEISIGFQARFLRKPDVYNFEFWNHFQNQLPSDPPQW